MTQTAAMTTADAAQTLAKNLAAIGRQNPELARTLEDASQIGRAENLQWQETPDGAATATYHGRALASRRDPREEARRLAGRVDLLDHAVVVVMGFALGYHVQTLAEQIEKRGVVIAYEPDLALLRAVLERIDHSSWIERANLIVLTNPEDRATLATAMQGAESMVVMGLTFLEHPPSRPRLGESTATLTKLLRDYVDTCRTTMVTTLLRSVDTARNQMLNLDQYTAGPGVGELQGAATGYPAVIVSAGPSLSRNIERLAEPGVRDRCVIIAVQTTLKPLLAMGVKPHFVTALDYHAISSRFYEGLDAEDVEGVTLIADTKANPVILDAYPGTVRCFASSFLDQLLGPLQREMGELPNGATVAHLALYFARYLGCDPITLIGQDLGFTDGLYYSPGNVIHDVWAPELGPFNTVETMEWQRIMRHRNHLSERRDVHGRSIFLDVQMLTYLQQFERDFARYEREGVRIIDATEGGVSKQHTTLMPLVEALDRFATRELPALPECDGTIDQRRVNETRKRLVGLRRDIDVIAESARQSQSLLTQMREHIDDQRRVNKLFEKLAVHRREVEQRIDTFRVLDSMNQLAAFKRLRADRRLAMQQQLEPKQRQAAQIDRDLVNVEWTAHGADEMQAVIDEAIATLDGASPVSARHEQRLMTPMQSQQPQADLIDDDVLPEAGGQARPARVIAFVPVDPDHNAIGRPRDLSATIAGRPVLQATLERIGRSERLESIVVVTNDPARVEAMIDRSAIVLPVEIVASEDAPLGPEQPAIAAARAFAPTAWRGGIGGMSIYDELLNPPVIANVLDQRGVDAAVLIGPDWPLIDITSDSGVDAMIDRHRRFPDQLGFMFTQAAPGFGACLISRRATEDLLGRSRNCTAGAMLGYLPHLAQPDPVAREANMTVDPAVRSSLSRAIADAPHRVEVIDRLLSQNPDATSVDAIHAIEDADKRAASEYPQHLIIELTPQRTSTGRFARSLNPNQSTIARRAMSVEMLSAILDQLAHPGVTAVTFTGLGDPLLHPAFDEMIAHAREAGVCAVHMRTELAVEQPTIDRLIRAEPDVVSVDLHADRAATYEAMMGGGESAFRAVLENIEYFAANRRALGPNTSPTALMLPWIVPRLQRCPATIDDLHSFYDRWMRLFGAAVIEGVPVHARGREPDEECFTHTHWTPRVEQRELTRRMMIHSDGGVPVDERDVIGRDVIARLDANSEPFGEIWRRLHAARCERFTSDDEAQHPGTLLP